MNYPLPDLDTISLLEAENKEESMRVTYEDPSQQNEKRRLLSIINNEPYEPEPETVQEQPKKGRNLVRRVTRK